MEEGLLRIAPDKEKARSILKMAETTLQMIATLDIQRFPSHIVKDYYDVLRELISVLLLLDGYKAYGEGAHRNCILYLQKHYQQFSTDEILPIDDFRMLRNKIAYDGFFITADYAKRKIPVILAIIKRLQDITHLKL